MNHRIKIYNSYTELAAAQGDFIPMYGETAPNPTGENRAVTTKQGATVMETEMRLCNKLPETCQAPINSVVMSGKPKRTLVPLIIH